MEILKIIINVIQVLMEVAPGIVDFGVSIGIISKADNSSVFPVSYFDPTQQAPLYYVGH